MAAPRGLRVTERPESQDVCFLRGEPYARLLRPVRAGCISIRGPS